MMDIFLDALKIEEVGMKQTEKKKKKKKNGGRLGWNPPLRP